MQWLDIALGLRVSATRFKLSSYCAKPHLVRAVRPSDFSYKHKAERTINLVLTPLSNPVGKEVADELRGALDTSPAGT